MRGLSNHEPFNSGITYDPTGDGYTAYNSTLEHDEFDLASLLENLSGPYEVEMNCVDFSNFFNILAASIGIQCYWEKIDTEFDTREILRAGRCTSDQWDDYSAWYDYPYRKTKFTFSSHQFSTIDNGGYKIIDAALLLYIPDNGYLSNPVDFQFQRGINSDSTYRSLLTDDSVSPSSDNNVTFVKQ